MRRGAFKVKTVAGLEQIAFPFVEGNLKLATQNVEEFLPLMGIRFSAPAAGLDAEQMGLHNRVAPGEKFHANAG